VLDGVLDLERVLALTADEVVADRHDLARHHGVVAELALDLVMAPVPVEVVIAVAATYGSDKRKILAKSSQSIQIDRDGAKRLIAIRFGAFHGLP